MEPYFSIIMPSYNQASFIKRSIDSVLNQSYRNFELIIVDAESDDGTQEILNGISDTRVKIICEKDNGQSDALNKGFLLAKGDVYGWLNSDDLYEQDAFLNAAQIFNEKDVSVVHGNWNSIDIHDKVLQKNYSFRFDVNQLFYDGFFLNTQSMFLCRNVHKDLYEFPECLTYTMDYHFLLFLGLRLQKKDFYYCNKFLGSFRRYQEQKTNGLNSFVLREHDWIRVDLHSPRPPRLFFKLIRLMYRFRRVYYYIVNGGIFHVIEKLR